MQARRGLSVAEIARRSGVTKGVLYKGFGRHQTLSIDQIFAIARGLDVSPVELMPIESTGRPDRGSAGYEDLVEALEAEDAEAIRLALARRLTTTTMAEVLKVHRLAPLDRDQLVLAIKKATEGLNHIAALAQGGPISTDEVGE